jgi:hypothetical protein
MKGCASERRIAGTQGHGRAIDEKRHGQEVQNREEGKEAQGREETREENHVKGCGDAHASLARVILPGRCIFDMFLPEQQESKATSKLPAQLWIFIGAGYFKREDSLV